MSRPAAPQLLPTGWESAVDVGTGSRYYFNRGTGETQWEPPGPAAGSSGSPTQGDYLPVANLSQCTSGGWRIKCRVLSKTDVRKFSIASGEGQFFKAVLSDSSGTISGTFFGRAVDAFFSQIRVGQVYIFSNGTVKPGNPRWDSTPYVVIFAEHSRVDGCTDFDEFVSDGPGSALAPPAVAELEPALGRPAGASGGPCGQAEAAASLAMADATPAGGPSGQAPAAAEARRS